MKQRALGLSVCAAVYLVATAIAVLSVLLLPASWSLLLRTLVADVVATAVVFIASLIFRNSSLYDPYWSLQPIVIAVAWFFLSGALIDVPAIAMLIAIVFWGGRLTGNWIRGWKGIREQDWRYTMLKEKSGSLWQLVNFCGIHLFPTIIVFLGMLPVWRLFNTDSVAPVGNLLSVMLSMLGLIVAIGSTALELAADEQMRSFKRHNPADAHIESGLWKYSRHPNYLGECMFWVGLFLIGMARNPGNLTENLWSALGFIAMFALFLGISIPMAEKRYLGIKTGYAEYRRRVSMLLLLPPKKG